MLTLAQASDMVIAGIAALSGLLADPGQVPADPPFAAKATARAAAARPEVVSALTLPRPAHDITVSKDGRIFMMMVDAPALVEWGAIARVPRISTKSGPFSPGEWLESLPGSARG